MRQKDPATRRRWFQFRIRKLFDDDLVEFLITTSRRRWSFSLKTMFVAVAVAAIVAASVGRDAHAYRKRHALRAWVKDTGGVVLESEDDHLYNLFDEKVAQFVLPRNRFSDEDARRIKRAFPEAAQMRD